MKRIVQVSAVLMLLLAFVASCSRPGPTLTPTRSSTSTPVPTPLSTSAPVSTPAPTPTAVPTYATPSTPTAATRIVTPTPGPTPSPTPVPKPTGELRIALSDLGNETLEPMLSATNGKRYLTLLYDPLVGATMDGKLSPDTGLANKWDMSPDATTYTFYLRKEIKFHNGDEVTADDVKFSLERVMRKESVSGYAPTLRANIKEITAVDPYTVRITTQKTYPWLAYDLSGLMGNEGMILPKKYILEKGDSYFATHPIGSGPYKFAGQVTGSYMRFEALDYHWRIGVPKYKTVTLQLVPEESTRIAMLSRGETDATNASWDKYKTLEAGHFIPYVRAGSDVVALWFNETWRPESPFNNVKVREALNLAINREELHKQIFHDAGKMEGYFPVGSWAIGYEPVPTYAYDPERAKLLLTEAGYGKGFSLDVYLHQQAALPEGNDLVQAVAGYWTAIGLKPQIIPIDYGAYRAKWGQQNLGVAVSWAPVSNRPLASGTVRLFLHSSSNLTFTKIPALDAMIDASERELDAKKYEEATRSIQKYARENHLLIPLQETAQLFFTNDKISDWQFPMHIYDIGVRYLVTRR